MIGNNGRKIVKIWMMIFLNIGVQMTKVRKLVKQLNKACVEHNVKREKKIWKKLIKKSLKHKHTASVR
jgi:tripartite-type tricarboxylate transporter receptor subunit TctC